MNSEEHKEIMRIVNSELSSDVDSPNNVSSEELAAMTQQMENDDKVNELEKPIIRELRAAIRRQKFENIVRRIKEGILQAIRRFCRLFSSRLRIVV